MIEDKKAKDFLAKRRSVSVKDLKGPGPGLESILEIMKAALRVPDHGKLEPWRVVLIFEKSREKFSNIIQSRGKALSIDPKKIEKNSLNVLNTPLIITIIGFFPLGALLTIPLEQRFIIPPIKEEGAHYHFDVRFVHF